MQTNQGLAYVPRVRRLVPNRRNQLVDPNFAVWTGGRGCGKSLAGQSLAAAWADEIATWKAGRSIESYMDEVIGEVMGDADGS